MFTSWIKFGKPEISMSLNGALAGLVAITSPCATVTPLSAIIIGAIAGIIVVLSVLFFDRIKVDDPVGAVSAYVQQ
jgi:Amt family ammonium transporter